MAKSGSGDLEMWAYEEVWSLNIPYRKLKKALGRTYIETSIFSLLCPYFVIYSRIFIQSFRNILYNKIMQIKKKDSLG
jgi:hypothetical protein